MVLEDLEFRSTQTLIFSMLRNLCDLPASFLDLHKPVTGLLPIGQCQLLKSALAVLQQRCHNTTVSRRGQLLAVLKGFLFLAANDN